MARVHERGPSTSCTWCLSWGGTFSSGLCLACYNFRPPRHGHYLGSCAACRREVPLRDGYCRLCWCQAKLDRQRLATDPRSAVVLVPYLTQVTFQQLFLTYGNGKRTPPPRQVPKRVGTKGRPLKAAPAPADRPRPGRWHQPPLFDPGHLARSRALRRFDLRTGPAPQNPWLDRALYVAHTTAEARGWRPVARMAIQRALVPLLADYTGEDPLYATEVAALALGKCIAVGLVLEVLAETGIVVDDRPPTFAVWLERKLADLPPAFARNVRDFAYSVREGTARSRPRAESTVYLYIERLLPAVTGFATEHDHLREVTTAEIRAHLATLAGDIHQSALAALRKLFAWAKRTGVIFRNPTLGIRGADRTKTLFQPLAETALTGLLDHLDAPDVRLAVALAAIHAAGHKEIRSMQLDDLDLPAQRITIGGKTRPLDPVTLQLTEQWLRHRAGRWPGTANPHLLITYASAMGHAPITAVHLNLPLRPLGLTLEKLRIDRQLEEAITVGGDPLHLAEVFGISPHSAVRYAHNARVLLAQHPAHDPAPATSPESQGPGKPAEPEPHSGSS
jgi:integrase